MIEVEWEKSIISELDITSTELSEDTLANVLTRMSGFTYLGLGYCEFFTDRVSNWLVYEGHRNRTFWLLFHEDVHWRWNDDYPLISIIILYVYIYILFRFWRICL